MTYSDMCANEAERERLPKSDSERVSGFLLNSVAFNFVNFEAPSSIREMNVSENREMWVQ